MNRPPMQDDDDDGFGDFRAHVMKLPKEQRSAQLKAMEDAVLQNLRENILRDLYADQPTPAPKQAAQGGRTPPTGDSGLDASLGRTPPGSVDYNSPDYKAFLKEYEDELRAGGMSPETDPQDWRAAMDEAYMMYNPNRSRSSKPVQGRQPVRPQGSGRVPPDASIGGRPTWPDGKPFEDWQMEQMTQNGLSPEEYMDQPPYTEPLPKGSMTGKPYPSEEEYGGGDDFYSNLYRWERDNGVPKGMRYKSPEYHKFVQDYQTKNKFGPTPDLRPTDNGGGKGFAPVGGGAIIDDMEEPPEGFDDVASPMKYQDRDAGFNDPARGRVEFGRDGKEKRLGAGAVDYNDPDQPDYTFPLPVGSMKGKPYPTEREYGGGDTYYSHLYRWEKDNGFYDLPRDSDSDMSVYNRRVDEYHAKNKLPPRYDENDFVDFLGRELGLTSTQDQWDAYHGHNGKLPDEKYNELLERFRAGAARTPAPRASSGIFGKRGINANRRMLED